VEVLSDPVFRPASALPAGPAQQLTKTPALPDGKAATRGPNYSFGARQPPAFGNQQLSLIPRHGEHVTDAVQRQVDPIEAVRQFPGQPYLLAVCGPPPHVVELMKIHQHL